MKLRTSGSPNTFNTYASSFIYFERDSFLSSITSLFIFFIFFGGNLGSEVVCDPGAGLIISPFFLERA